MKKFFFFSLVAFVSSVFVFQTQLLAKIEEVEVKMIAPSPMWVGKPSNLTFQLIGKNSQKSVNIDALELAHEKLMHVVGVREDLNEFFHIHPVVTDPVAGVFSIDRSFNKPGLYAVWAEIQQQGTVKMFSLGQLKVLGSGIEAEKKVYKAKMVSVGNFHANLNAPETILAGQEVKFSVDVHKQDGSQAALQNWLGAPMHLNVFSEDLTSSIHLHPENNGHVFFERVLPKKASASSEPVMDDAKHEEGHGEEFRAIFPKPGLYKMFAQFRPEGDRALKPEETRVAEFWVEVKDAQSVAGKALNGSVFVFCGLLAAVLLLGIYFARRKKQISPQV